MNALAIHFAFQFKSTVRNPSQLLLSYLFPLAFYILVGGVMTQLNPGFRENLVSAMTIFTVMTGALLGLPGPLVEQRNAGIFRAYRVSGVPAAAVLAMPALTTALHSLIAASIVAATAPVLFDAPAPTSWPALALCTLLGAVLFSGLGTLIGSISESARGTMLFSQALFLPSMLLGGLMVPLAALPENARGPALLLPTNWLVQLEQGLAFGRDVQIPSETAIAVLVTGVAAVFVSVASSFHWDRLSENRGRMLLMAPVALVPFVVGAVLYAH